MTGDERLSRADLERSGALPRSVMDAAEAIVDDVRSRGDAAVREYCLRFDGACPDSFRVPDEVVQGALDMVDPEFLKALTLAANQIREFHEREREQSWFTTRPDGTILGVKVTPVPSAAVYVPGGRAQYPSTVLMDTIPAKVAGVPRVVMVTPPQRDGSLSAYTLAAAAVAAYAAWTVAPSTTAKFGTSGLAATVLPVAFGVVRYLRVVLRGEGGGRPEKTFLRTPALLAAVLVWLASCVAVWTLANR